MATQLLLFFQCVPPSRKSSYDHHLVGVEKRSQSWLSLNLQPPSLIHDDLDHRALVPCNNPSNIQLFFAETCQAMMPCHDVISYAV